MLFVLQKSCYNICRNKKEFNNATNLGKNYEQRQDCGSSDDDFDFENFYTYTAEICHTLDIATPVVLSKHVFHFLNFHNTTFFPQDFPEEVTFSRLVLEDITE